VFPVDAPMLVQARAMGEAVIGEIELAAQFLPGPIVAITGSNGKTTTTTLTGEILAAAGFPRWSAGTLVLRRFRWRSGRSRRP
jgi:UDP-N-acetylmuramoylalanine--D-glutamate ligase